MREQVSIDHPSIESGVGSGRQHILMLPRRAVVACRRSSPSRAGTRRCGLFAGGSRIRSIDLSHTPTYHVHQSNRQQRDSRQPAAAGRSDRPNRVDGGTVPAGAGVPERESSLGAGGKGGERRASVHPSTQKTTTTMGGGGSKPTDIRCVYVCMFECGGRSPRPIRWSKRSNIHSLAPPKKKKSTARRASGYWSSAPRRGGRSCGRWWTGCRK